MEIGQVAPTFALRDAQDRLVELAGLHGRVVYIDFWASWCVPCRHSFPFMSDLQRQYGSRLAIVAIDVDARRTDADKFLAKYAAPFTVVFDPDGHVAARYAVAGMPSSYLIDVNGKVRFVHIGFRETTPRDVTAELDGLVR